MFPDGLGDPSGSETIRQINNGNNESFVQKLQHLIKFREYKDGKLVHWLPSHPRLGYWAYIMYCFEKRFLDQENWYIKQTFGETIPTIDKLCAMLQSNNYLQLISKTQYNAKNIVATNLYWYPVKQQFRYTLQQHGAPTIVFILSCSELCSSEFRALFSDASNYYL